ncbi:MAG: YihY/virulence factor BrkB family protein [Nitrospirae bacterium]|nr:YihY/virulence factor BrkB family protein [Nitrospirota bacterium]
MKLIFRSFIDFFRDGGPLLAGAVAYFFLMSFIPFSLMLVAIFGYFLGESGGFYHFFSARLAMFFPAAVPEITKQLTSLISYRKIGIVTFVIYAYFSYQFYMALEEATRVIFRQKKRQPLLTSVVSSFLIVTLIAALIVMSFAATSAVRMLQSLLEVFPSLKISGITASFVQFVIPVFLVLFITTALYKFLPLKKVLLSHAFGGGLFTAVFLEVARHPFTLYVVTAAGRYGAIYGSLSTFVILLLWVFYSSTIFLVGAEIVRNLRDRSSP